MPRSFRKPFPDLDQERALLRAWQGCGDTRALGALIAASQPQMRAMARRLSRTHMEDLLAEGQIALIEAASRWQAQGSVRFFSYASIGVRAAMLQAHCRLQTPVSQPERALRDALSGRRGEAVAAQAEAALNLAGIDENMPDLSTPAAEDIALGRERRRSLRQALAGALRPLGRTERHLVMRHLLRGEDDFDRLATGLGMAPARARQIEGRALHKMRNALLHAGFGPGDLN